MKEYYIICMKPAIFKKSHMLAFLSESYGVYGWTYNMVSANTFTQNFIDTQSNLIKEKMGVIVDKNIADGLSCIIGRERIIESSDENLKLLNLI